MRLAIIRQRYTPYGGAERFVERALQALVERGVEIALVTRRWPHDGDPRVTPVIVDPPYVGRTLRDFGFARAACAAVARMPDTLVQSHERIACCDIYRAGDGVHAVWVEELARDASAAGSARAAGQSLSSLHARRRAPAVREPEAAARDLHIADGPGGNPRALRAAARAPSRHLQRDRSRGVPSGTRRASRQRSRAPRHRPRRVRVPPRRLRVRAEGRRARARGALGGAGARRTSSSSAATGIRRGTNGSRGGWVWRDRVTFAGAQTDPKPYYGAADAFVLPTLYDALSNAVLEALACGLPVVTSERCGAGRAGCRARRGPRVRRARHRRDRRRDGGARRPGDPRACGRERARPRCGR